MSDRFVMLLDRLHGLAHRRNMVLMRRMMPRLSERNTVAAAPAGIDLLLRLQLAVLPVLGGQGANLLASFAVKRAIYRRHFFDVQFFSRRSENQCLGSCAR
jgi:hypothetical protein